MTATTSNIHTTRFPKPDPALAFAEWKIYGEPNLPLRVPLDDWAGAAKRVEQDQEWADWLQQQRGLTDEWMAKRRDRVEWIAGWWHDFVSPLDGSTLSWTPDEPGENTLSSPSDARVVLTPKLHGGWVYQFRIRHGEAMLAAARLFRLTGDKRYSEWVMEQLDFYADNFDNFPDQLRGEGIWKSRARLMHQPLDEAVNLLKHINAALLVEGEIAPARKARWIEKLFRPQAELLDESFQSIHNIACWQRCAMAHVALYAGDETIWERAIGARFGIRNQLREGVTSDYFWYEQSLGYNSYVVNALQPLFEFAARVGRLDDLREEAEIVENLMLSPLAIRFPDGRLPTPADARMGRVNLQLVAGAARLFPTSIGIVEAATQLNWNTLLDPPKAQASSAGAEALPAVQSRNMESSRMALLKRDDWQVFFHYGQLTTSHAQAEALNFEATFRGIDITHDAGTVGYGSPLHSGYFTRGLAHNVPLFDGEGQRGWNEGELIAFDADSARVEAAQPYAEGAMAKRALQIENNVLCDVVSLEALASTRLGLVLHLQGEVRLPAELVSDATFADSRPAPFGFWKEVRTAIFHDSASFEVVFAGVKMRVTFQVPGTFSVSHANTPDAPPRRRQSFYLETTGQATQFTTLFEPLFEPLQEL